MTRRRSSWPSAHGRSSSGSGIPAVALHAPITGVIVAVQATVGEHVQTDAPVFTILQYRDRPDRSAASRVRPGAPRAVLPGHLRNPCRTRHLCADPQCSRAKGVWSSLGTTVDAKTRTVPLVYEVPNPDGHLRIGMALTVYVETAQVTEALAVPVSALVEEDGQAVAFVQVAGETFQKRDLTLGIQDGDLRPGPRRALRWRARGHQGRLCDSPGVRLDHHSRPRPCPLRGAPR